MKTLAIFCLTFFLSLSYQPIVENDKEINSYENDFVKNLSEGDKDDCTYKGFPMKGRVRIVDYGEDLKIREVTYGEDIKVLKKDYPAHHCYEWQIVDYAEDLKVRFVDYGEDLKVRFVNYTP
jgi:hypothetical protein